MKNIKYQWKRYWVPYKNDGISLTDHGFLEDPTGEFGKYISPSLATLEDLKKLGCLILVGEPGIGKSSEIKELYDATVKESGDDHALWIDLKDVMTPEGFISRLTDDPRYKNWSENKEPLYLFLDSFDEGTFSFPRFANAFSALFTDQHKNIPNLYLRISCRTALWSSYMEGSLVVLWGEETCQTHELCPLTKKDVETALEAQGIDKQAFLTEVYSKDASGLAGKPLTLKFLMDLFLENKGHLPDRKSEIYSRGCDLLVQEPQAWKRVNPPVKPKLNLPQKIAVAERIAIATLVGGKPTIVIEDEGKLLDNEINIIQLHGREIIDDVPVTLGDEEIKEVLNTGLFSARGNGKIGWAHQTYGEYLAAKYITRHKLPWKQVQSLVFQDPLGIGIFQVVPQLYEVSAWLASLEPSFFDNAVLLDPEFLLLSDANVITDQQKQALVEQLLVRLDRGELVDRWETFNDTNYKKLNHPNIAAQLQPYIEDSSKDMVVRRAAIDIARACKVSSLEKLLVKIALDGNDNLLIRVHAALTVAHIGSDESKQALKPLADAGFPDDPEDELKGAVLRALWPNHISNQEVFSLITPPKKRSFHGAYYGFVDKELAESLRTEDVLPALSWIEANALTPERLEYFLGTLSDAIMLKAWEEIADPQVLEKFAHISYERLNEFAGIVGDRALSEKIAAKFQKAIEDQDEGRRSLIKQLAQIIHEKDKKPGRKAFILYHRSHVQLILPKDLEWLIKWLEGEKGEEMQKIISEIISSAFRVNDTSHIDLVYKARQRNSFLEEETRFWFEPVKLDSDFAKEQRERWSDEKKWREKREKNEREEILKVLSPDKISELLEKSEAGDMDSWWRLNNAMCMYQHELDDSKFEDLPGWKIIDENIQKRIIECGRKFLSEQESKPEIWLGKGKIYFPAIAGYRAIKAFHEREPEFIEKQTSEFWKRWASITLGMPLVSNDRENGKIIALAYKYAPDEVIATLDVLIDDEAQRYNSLLINDLLDDCLDDRMSTFLLGKAQQQGFSPKAAGEILRFLLGHDDLSAKEYIKSKIAVPLPEDADKKEEVLSAASSLLQNADQSDWEFLWDHIQQDNEFGRALIFKSHDSPLRGSGVLQKISEPQLADLHIWLTNEFPPEEYKQPEGSGTVTPKISIGDWRDSVLRVLMDKGTAEACRQIDRIAAALPQYKWIKRYTLVEARRIAAQKSWQPPEVNNLFKLVENHDLRLINSPDELMDSVLDSIARFQQVLHSQHQPRVIRLWNQDRRRKKQPVISWPKDELDLSDELASHLNGDLDDRGIFVGREMTVTRVNRLDIHIKVFGKDHLGRPTDSHEIIIEVKGCWHPELDTAMETQLVGKYLSANGCHHGIYLVGWFNCDAWNDSSDTRKQKVPNLSLEQAREKFGKQADALSAKHAFRVESVILNTELL
ncbi:MAG: hypothetical protein UW84_C0008G0004 [Candidatus Collierbacteria bacterium GW2011_GWA2_44_99]|uniref:NACHT domain-containing protein n=2 Tax=Patescibacteria group TaxID=1783273 RepID=A0A0G1KSL9_9BACT|nr:MAG: hypothetical protein US05_C0017G0003 [Candidatus Nomurabacteria bacterium GW2011_GWA1_36_15]KKT53957.1 MAG: hypothetical protein UW48_C0019G0003 [Microgenomates group bacterium GW2011_GWC1_44_23]KKT86573.1 MAG: hypothetical protein UW84_C0008G0004 [Candidatus Collierbacteria bacterium GW2011_GWA2_44_99]